jgi:hypothetical protein
VNLDEVKDYIRENLPEFYTQQTIDFLSFIFKFYQNGMICFKLFDKKFEEISSVSGMFNECYADGRNLIILIGDRNKEYYKLIIPIKGMNIPGFGNITLNKEIYTIGFSYA